MDRKLYLELCQKVSMLKESGHVKQNVPNELLVKFGNILYYPVAYELSFDKGKTVHKAILHDLHANSITKCNLERVVKYE